MTDWIGKSLGKVRIESRLARGGMAEVYLGTHTTLQRKVAVKILRSYQTDDVLRPLQRFELEARAVAKLRHPNIVQVYDFDTIDDQPYLVMEYISGPSLSTYLNDLHKRGGRLGLSLISRLLTRLASALQYAHESGVIHRDIKPGNILLTSRSIRILPGETLPLDLEPVLTDFGLVRFLNSSRQTVSGLITGTPAYMSPEQALGQTTDERTDIYSLGIVLYELLSGRVPFDGETTMSILLKHINEAPPPVPGLSPALQRVLDRALAKSPAERFENTEEFAATFNASLEQTSDASTLVTIPQVLPTRADKAPATRSPRRWLLPVLLTVFLVVTGLAFFLSGQRQSSAPGTPTNPAVAASLTPELIIPVTLGATSTLHFHDVNARLDGVTLLAQTMPAPPENSQYRVWLVNDQERLPLGTLNVDAGGTGELTFEDPQNRNLLAAYERVEITLEPEGITDSNGQATLAYAYSLPESGLVYLRGLLASFPRTPGEIGLVHGLTVNARLIEEAATEMITRYEDGDEDGTRENAESMINILVGNQSENYKDWDGDGRISDPGDGYGLLLNGTSFGYIQSVYSQADYAINSPGASRNMIVNGENVKVCAQNLANWAPDLRDQLLSIHNAAELSSVDAAIQRSAGLADRILHGVDQDEDGDIEPIPEECGVLVARDSAYQMADMPLLPLAVGASNTGTAIPTTETGSPTVTSAIPVRVTPTRRPGEGASPGPVAPTQGPVIQPPATSEPNPPEEPPPTEEERPTREPRPTNENRPTRESRPTDEPQPTNEPGPPSGEGPPGQSP
jgi:serine/threonine protein kinase